MIIVQNSNATPHQGFPGKSQRRSTVNLNPLISKGWDVGVYTCIYCWISIDDDNNNNDNTDDDNDMPRSRT